MCMTVEYVEYKGKSYPTRWVYLMNVLFKGQCELVQVADYTLFAAMEEDYEKGAREAVEIDNDIYFYCEPGFIASEPTDDEIIEYLKKNLT